MKRPDVGDSKYNLLNGDFNEARWADSNYAYIDYLEAKFKNLTIPDVSDSYYPKCTRVEVIDNTGRAYTKYGCKDVQVQMQDQDRTLKVFIS